MYHIHKVAHPSYMTSFLRMVLIFQQSITWVLKASKESVKNATSWHHTSQWKGWRLTFKHDMSLCSSVHAHMPWIYQGWWSYRWLLSHCVQTWGNCSFQVFNTPRICAWSCWLVPFVKALSTAFYMWHSMWFCQTHGCQGARNDKTTVGTFLWLFRTANS